MKTAAEYLVSRMLSKHTRLKPSDIPRCEARALQCERQAERANMPELKVIFRQLARAWRSAADDIANSDRQTPKTQKS
jgi:hypothetical protein